MDVVKTNIAKLKGIVEISSEVGKGTIITLKVPANTSDYSRSSYEGS